MRRPLSYCGVNSGIQLVEMSDAHFRTRQGGSEAVVGRVVAIRPGKTHIDLGLIGGPDIFSSQNPPLRFRSPDRGQHPPRYVLIV